jgi:hypothetical protein
MDCPVIFAINFAFIFGAISKDKISSKSRLKPTVSFGSTNTTHSPFIYIFKFIRIDLKRIFIAILM